MSRFGQKAAKNLSKREKALPREEVDRYLAPHLDRAADYLQAANSHQTPLYLFDAERLLARAAEFERAFSSRIENFLPHFAIKSCNSPLVAAALADFGWGLDASSGVELSMAIETGAKSILFTGPGKTVGELAIAAQNQGRVLVMADSFGELQRLHEAASAAGTRLEIGVRLTNDTRGLWRKFGIPPSRLPEFARAAKALGNLDFIALHFHTSWNMGPEAQERFLGVVGRALGKLDAATRARIKVLDIGGGYWPTRGEWTLPRATPRGQLLGAAGLKMPQGAPATLTKAAPIGVFAEKIAAALEKHIFTKIKPAIYAEPGRFVADDSFCILLRVLDEKGRGLVITDGGTNIVGWEKYEFDYCPIINLSKPSLKRTKCLVTGSLCTPHDIWGEEVIGEMPVAGDFLLIPGQGAYTFSLRQEFIKPVAPVVSLPPAKKPA